MGCVAGYECERAVLFSTGSGALASAFKRRDCELCGHWWNFGLARIHSALGIKGWNDHVDENIGESSGAGGAGECDCAGNDYDAGRSAGVGAGVRENCAVEENRIAGRYCGSSE